MAARAVDDRRAIARNRVLPVQPLRRVAPGRPVDFGAIGETRLGAPDIEQLKNEATTLPEGKHGRVPQLDPRKYQGKTWATRRRLWVDRVASAWLIRRFIDRDATFRWLAKPSDCPKSALGFDFDGATFTHVGERVTFEVLLASFGLEDDAGLMRIAKIVHVLDAGGEPAPEAQGFEAVLAGARERLPDDDILLAEMSAVLDSLHAHFTREAARAKG